MEQKLGVGLRGLEPLRPIASAANESYTGILSLSSPTFFLLLLRVDLHDSDGRVSFLNKSFSHYRKLLTIDACFSQQRQWSLADWRGRRLCLHEKHEIPATKTVNSHAAELPTLAATGWDGVCGEMFRFPPDY